MKIRFIGTGNITAVENNACYLIDDHILIDCGNGIVKTVGQYGYDVNRIDTVVITHLHGDHFLDLPFLIMQRCFTGAENRLKIYCPEHTEEAVDGIMKIAYPDVENFDSIKKRSNTEFFEIGNCMVIEETDMRICFLKVAHGDCDDAYGFTLRISDSCVGFSGDSAYCEAIEDIVRNSDAAVLDMSFAKGGKDHMGIDTVCEIISNNHKPVYATHMSTASRKQAEKLNNDLLIVTKDGQEVVI